MKLTKKEENMMLDTNLTSLVIKDILSTKEYSYQGIANYTNFHEDVVVEVASGRNTNPSVNFFRQVIEIHRMVRRDLYKAIMKKLQLESNNKLFL